MSLWKTDTIVIGHRGDSGKQIKVDISSALITWPGATAEILAIRPGESQSYLVDADLADGILTWTVSAQDTAIAGDGQAEIVIYDDGKIAYSCIARTLIRESMAGTDPSIDPMETWVARVIAAKDETVQASAEAKEALATVQDLADQAAADAERSEQAASEADEARSQALEQAETAKGYAESAEADAQKAEHFADLAAGAAAEKGVFWLETDESGTLWYYYSETLDELTFEMDPTDPTGTLYAVLTYDP